MVAGQGSFQGKDLRDIVVADVTLAWASHTSRACLPLGLAAKSLGPDSQAFFWVS